MFKIIVAELDAQTPEAWIEPAWKDNLKVLDDLLLDDGTFREDFLSVVSAYSGTGGLGSEENRLWISHRALVTPLQTDDPVAIAHSAAFAELGGKLGLDYAQLRSALVWGAGYGSQLAVLREMAPRAVIFGVDLPLCLVVQDEFCHRQGIETRLILDPNAPFSTKAINLVPLPFWAIVPHVELFVATHSLSECPPELQNLVARQGDWNGARYVLVAYGENKDFGSETYENFHRLFEDLESRHASAFTADEKLANRNERMFDRRI